MAGCRPSQATFGWLFALQHWTTANNPDETLVGEGSGYRILYLILLYNSLFQQLPLMYYSQPSQVLESVQYGGNPLDYFCLVVTSLRHGVSFYAVPSRCVLLKRNKNNL